MVDKINLESVIQALRKVLPRNLDFIGLHEPEFGGNEWLYVKECLDTGWVSSVGKFVDRFEDELAAYTGAKRAIAVVNGTAALHICLQLVGVEAGDEVLIPALTFVATANAVAYCGAIPHFVDSEESTLGIDPQKLKNYLRHIARIEGNHCVNRETGRRIKAVIAVHTFGHPVDLDPLAKLCKEFKLELIEDAAESLGSFYKGRHTGNWGRVSALSFNGNKIMTTGGGGAILTNDESLADVAKHITTTAKVPHRWSFLHDRVGYNYRMPNINAALGCAQLEQMPSFLSKKRSLASKYAEVFQDVKGVRFFIDSEICNSNYWLNLLFVEQGGEVQRDRLLELTNERGIMTRPPWKLMHKLPMFLNSPRMDLSYAENLEKRAINIPSSAKLGEQYVS
ncbi:LegC family aminotransferase [Geitlerinema sp. CS-897]|nr:LegC family aminotransferase [Geitlerinema sp. CS-897]